MAPERMQAFVLQTRDYRETSLLATFFTRDYGKIKAVVKGVREGRTRFGSSLEPFSLNEIVLYRRKRGDLHLVTEADLVERFDSLRQDLERWGTASYFAELLERLTEEQHCSEEIFGLFHEALKFLTEKNSPKRSARIFEAKLMQALGWMADLRSCLRCGGKNHNEYYFSVSSGGAVCPACRRGEGQLVPFSKGAMLFLNQAIQKPFSELHQMKVTREVGEKVEQVMRHFLGSHLGARPRALVFLDKIESKDQELLCTSKT